MRLFDGDTFEFSGLMFRVSLPIDEGHEPPWEDGDGRGIVSEWTRRDKAPGERVLCSDRGSRRYFDVQATMRKARAEGWDALPYGGTVGQRAARAVDAEFQRLRRWCNDDWTYIGVQVTLLDDDGCETDEDEAVWGIESDCEDYIAEVAQEMAEEIAVRVRHEAGERAAWAARDVATV